jgi:hypothetical protein
LGHGARGEDGEDGEDVAIGFLEARVAPWLFQWIGLIKGPFTSLSTVFNGKIYSFRLRRSL